MKGILRRLSKLMTYPSNYIIDGSRELNCIKNPTAYIKILLNIWIIRKYLTLNYYCQLINWTLENKFINKTIKSTICKRVKKQKKSHYPQLTIKKVTQCRILSSLSPLPTNCHTKTQGCRHNQQITYKIVPLGAL